MSILFNHLLNRPDPGYPLIVEEVDTASGEKGEIGWTLSQLKQQSLRLADSLSRSGIQPGDRVALMFMNQKEYLCGFFAVLAAGGVVVPINITLPAEDILYVIQNAGAKLILSTQAFAAYFEQCPLPVWVANQTAQPVDGRFESFESKVETGNPDFSPAAAETPHAMRVLMYTSGTSGMPKGVMLSEENLMSNLAGVTPRLEITSADRLLLAMPLFHSYGQIIALYALQNQAALYLIPQFSPKRLLQTLAHNQITVMPLAPTLFSLLMSGIQRAGIRLPALRACISGGMTLSPRQLHTIEETLGIMVLEGYGMTETSPVLAVNCPSRGSIPGSVGRPLDNVDMCLLNDDGAFIPIPGGNAPSDVGEIAVKGPNVMLGYYHLPEETRSAFTPDGYLKTGDLGHFDAEGNLYISAGRKKDLIIKAGENIAPVRIEQVLFTYPGVQAVAVLGIPDDKLGEDILACLELQPGIQLNEGELKKFCLASLPPLMVPARFKMMDALPKNATGKILKPALKAQYLAELAAAAQPVNG